MAISPRYVFSTCRLVGDSYPGLLRIFPVLRGESSFGKDNTSVGRFFPRKARFQRLISVSVTSATVTPPGGTCSRRCTDARKRFNSAIGTRTRRWRFTIIRGLRIGDFDRADLPGLRTGYCA